MEWSVAKLLYSWANASIFGSLAVWSLRRARTGIFTLVMQDAAHALTKQFLAWVAEAPRSYKDADAWRRSCPHLSVWEDAIANGLIQFKNGSTMKESQILLTGRGRSFLKVN